jgi:hypothetical protein
MINVVIYTKTIKEGKKIKVYGKIIDKKIK